VRVDDVAYNVFGVSSDAASTSATVNSAAFSATHSIFELTAGTADITLDFFSPVSFTNYTRQSLPFSYLTVSATGVDGATPDVQIYSDIDESWTGQTSTTTGSLATSGDTSIFELVAETQQLYSQSANEQALWGTTVFASRPGTGDTLTAQSGAVATVRDEFIDTGALSGTHATWATGSVAGLAHDLGTVSSQTNVTYAVGLTRAQAIDYLGAAYTHYYQATYKTIEAAVVAFLDDYDEAWAEGASLEAEIDTKGTAAGGQNYTDILQLSVTQTLGGIDFVIPQSTLDTSGVVAFIKEISSDGNVNTVDIIVELIPFFAIFNIEYLRDLVEPVVAYLASGAWPLDYTVHDLGSAYPNATGHDDGVAEIMPVEECGNLLIMVAVIQKYSANTTWTQKYASLFAQYADYLIANGEFPTLQLSTNDGLGEFTNMTQLGVKAAVGLAAYGNATGNSTLTSYGAQFASTIYTDGVGISTSTATGEPYFVLTYGSTTFFMLFNLYPDRLLGLDVFPSAAYAGQSDYYALDTVRATYGVPLEGAVTWGKTDWQMWSAAVADDATRADMVDDLWKYASDGLNTAPFPDRYTVSGTGEGDSAAGFRARPVLGAHFAIWALNEL
jgi:hypothetical protein